MVQLAFSMGTPYCELIRPGSYHEANPWYWIDRRNWWDSEHISQATWAAEIRGAKIKASRAFRRIILPLSKPDKRMRHTTSTTLRPRPTRRERAEAIMAVSIPDEICPKKEKCTADSRKLVGALIDLQNATGWNRA
jgi:hypothetical protein